MKKIKRHTIAVINKETKEVISRHMDLHRAMKSMGENGGFNKCELIDL
jgi:hypothetical protein